MTLFTVPPTQSADFPSRRGILAAGAWASAAVMLVAPASALAASGSTVAGRYMTLFDTQAAITNQNDTNATTWPHGVISDLDQSQNKVKFQLGMEMMVFDQSMYNSYTYDTYRNWTSGPITVELTFDNTVYKLLDSQSTWVDSPDNGGTAWQWTSTSSSGNYTTLTFTHTEIAYNGNTLGMPTQTGSFEVGFQLLKAPGVQAPPVNQPAGGRTVTNSMSISVSSGLGQVSIPYVQEDSALIR